MPRQASQASTSPDPASRPGASTWTEARLLGALLVLTFAVFAGALGAPFHFDDWSLPADPAVAHPDGWWRVLAGYVAPDGTGMPPRTRPLTYLTFWAQWAMGILTPEASHGVNLALHLLNVVLAWLFVSRAVSRPIALVAVAIFALHPIQTEPVVYVFARATLLSSTLALGAMVSWQRNRFGLAALALAAAIFAKEDAAAWLGVLFLYEAVAPTATIQSTGRKFLAVLGLTAVAVFAFWRVQAAATAIDRSGVLGDAAISPLAYLATQGTAVWHYLGLLTMWSPLNVDHAVRIASPSDLMPWFGWLAVAGALGAIAYFYRRSEITWAVFSAGVLLIPTSTILPLADPVVERRLYVPLLFAALGAAAIVAPPPGWLRPWWIRAGLAIILSGISFVRVSAWRTEARLWRAAVQQSPDKPRPWLQWAGALGRESPEQAELRLQAIVRARELDPSSFEPWLQLGVYWLQAGDPARAAEGFEGAGLRGASPAIVQANLGAAVYMAGRTRQAQQMFAEALNYDPCHWDARNNLILVNRNLPPGERIAPPSDENCLWTARQQQALAAAQR